ncbi:MAG: DUF559 domain-containing protein [Chloroflexi bacterium]|nr:MAG: DUF559 domain-containing protein [Chloroflexota bacterium]
MTVGRRPRIPPQLKGRPFSLDEARAAGLTLDMLSGRSWLRLGSELYCWSGLREDPWQLLLAWRAYLPPEAVFTGLTAAWLYRLDVDPVHPIEVVVPFRSGVRSRPGLNVRRCGLAMSHVTTVRGMRATTIARTLRDLCRRVAPVEALIAIDGALRLRLIDKVTLTRQHSLGALAAPAESPMETRLRWLLLQAGLPQPEVQAELRDTAGRFLGRADLFYPAARLVVEYDGTSHRERLVEDNRRQNLLINAGFRILRFTATDVHQRSEVVVAQVRSALVRVSPDSR